MDNSTLTSHLHYGFYISVFIWIRVRMGVWLICFWDTSACSPHPVQYEGLCLVLSIVMNVWLIFLGGLRFSEGKWRSSGYDRRREGGQKEGKLLRCNYFKKEFPACLTFFMCPHSPDIHLPLLSFWIMVERSSRFTCRNRLNTISHAFPG